MRFAALPTPFEPLPRLGAELGIPLWVKRDDLTGLGLGGNKVRKLEYLIGDALATNCDTVVTFGAVQSNHARQTAAACARVGLHCVLILTRTVPKASSEYEHGGNVALDHLFGAQVHVVDHDPDAIYAAVAEVRDQLARTGRRARWVPAGGSDAVGGAGYVGAAFELLADASREGVEISHVIVGSSSGGTQAGLLVGLCAAQSKASLVGAAVYRDAAHTIDRVQSVAQDVAALLGVPTPDPSLVLADDRCLGQGYGIVDDRTSDALRRAARSEGLVLDPVYSGKAMAVLAQRAADGVFAEATGVVFVHTGGSPSLFSYLDDVDVRAT
ncbi:MAG: D-cysteine desulfhydrase family protein [Actinomycetes bacterium]